MPFPFPLSLLVGRSTIFVSPSLTFFTIGAAAAAVAEEPPPFLPANLMTSPFDVAREVDLGEERIEEVAAEEDGVG